MKNNFLMLMFLFLSAGAMAEAGPIKEQMKVEYIYSYDSVYIRFSSGAMPGCHGENSGRLYTANPLFNQLYSHILALSLVGEFKGQVVYTISNPGSGQWSQCAIQGLAVHPD